MLECLVNAIIELKLFKKITLDKNPIHENPKLARKYGFKGPIAHGMLAGSLLSNIIGNKIPGAGALWTDCNITFSKPVFKNDIFIYSFCCIICFYYWNYSVIIFKFI